MERIIITPEEYKNIKNIISSYHQTPYDIKKYICWTLEDNDFFNQEQLLNIIQLYINISIPDSFIKKYNIKNYHIKTINFFNLKLNDGVCIYPKKPLGNLDIYADVAHWIIDEFNINCYLNNWIKENKKVIEKVIQESMYIFDKMILELDLGSLEWEKYYSIWRPTEEGQKQYNIYLRKNKLKRILND
jgi:hypothetical protein